MTRFIIATMALTAATLFQAAPIDAQERWGFELRGSGAVSTQDAARDTHQNGGGLEGTVQYRILTHVAAYAGWSHTQFNALESIAGPDMHLEETGYAAGLRFEHPLRSGWRTAGWVRAGATLNQLELENPDGDIIEDSGHGFGWEFATGLAVPIHRRWSATPGLRYRAISRDLEIDDVTMPVELQSVAFELGLRVRF